MLRSDLKIVFHDDTLQSGTFVINNATVEIGFLTDGFCVNTLVFDNPVASCQSLYMVNLDLKQPSKDIRLTFSLTREQTLFVTSQSLIRRNGLLVKQETNWLTHSDHYTLMLAARADFQSSLESPELLELPELPILNKIEQGYLVKLLMLKHKIGSSEGLEALYGLQTAWSALDKIDDCFSCCDLQQQVKLINFGLLGYYDVNKYLWEALKEGKWITLKSILDHYKDCNRLNLTLALKYLANYPESIPDIPKELFDLMLTIASKRR